MNEERLKALAKALADMPLSDLQEFVKNNPEAAMVTLRELRAVLVAMVRRKRRVRYNGRRYPL